MTFFNLVNLPKYRTPRDGHWTNQMTVKLSINNISYYNISEVLSLLQKYKQKMITYNGDNYTNKFYNMIYLVMTFFNLLIFLHKKHVVMYPFLSRCVNFQYQWLSTNCQNITINYSIFPRKWLSFMSLHSFLFYCYSCWIDCLLVKFGSYIIFIRPQKCWGRIMVWRSRRRLCIFCFGCLTFALVSSSKYT
jgi:hypothetical protein